MSDSRPDNDQFKLVGERIELRSFTTDHVTRDYIGWLNDPLVTRYSNQRFKHHDTDSCLSYLKSFVGTDNIFLAMHLRDSGHFIGTMTAYLAVPHAVIDLGILIGDRSAWGQGLGLEAWQLLMGYMLEVKKVRKITGGTLSCNLGMISIMKKSGMQPDGVRTRQELVEGVAHDIVYFARFNHD